MSNLSKLGRGLTDAQKFQRKLADTLRTLAQVESNLQRVKCGNKLLSEVDMVQINLICHDLNLMKYAVKERYVQLKPANKKKP